LAARQLVPGDPGVQHELTAVGGSHHRARRFTVAQDTRRSFLDLFERLRANRIIPPLG
jgi:hypothetical protein